MIIYILVLNLENNKMSAWEGRNDTLVGTTFFVFASLRKYLTPVGGKRLRVREKSGTSIIFQQMLSTW